MGLNLKHYLKKLRLPNIGGKKCRIGGETILLIATVASVILGIVIGVSIKFGVEKPLTPRQVMYISFPGVLFLRMLKLLILPLITSSLITSLTSLDSKTAGRMGLFATAYYFCTTLLAVITGIVLVLLIQPGKGTDLTADSNDTGQNCKGTKPSDTILDLLRNMFPSNIVEAAFKSAQTCMKYKNVTVGGTSKIITYEEYDALNETDRKYWMDFPVLTSKDGMNILGLVVFSIVFGMVINKLEAAGQPLADFFRSLEAAMMKLVSLVIWFSPIGIMFLIAGQIVEMEDLVLELKRLAMYMATVISGLVLHGFITLPLLFFFLTRRNPLKFIYGMLQALLTALGTASSSATMPLTLKCLEENNKVDGRVTRFMIPLGATINMDGTALYEAVAALYIAQVTGRSLSIGEIILISLTATLASIGAAGIPQAGLVTMIMVLIAVNLDAQYYTLIVPVDWFLDRIRTMINVHGDSLGTGIVEKLCQSQLDSDQHVAKLSRQEDRNGHSRSNSIEMSKI